MCWSLINSLPPPRGSGTDEERKRANEHDLAHQQQRLMAERLRQERYYLPGVSIDILILCSCVQRHHLNLFDPASYNPLKSNLI
jgi:hypothetical protein